jgi:hypothetical protein
MSDEVHHEEALRAVVGSMTQPTMILGFLTGQESQRMCIQLKQVVFLALLLLNWGANALNLCSKETLVQECRALELSVSALVPSQEKMVCTEELMFAADKLKDAAHWINEGTYIKARLVLDQAISLLYYAELNACNQYVQIAHSKLAAIRIRNALC